MNEAAIEKYEVVVDGSWFRDMSAGGWAAHVRRMNRGEEVRPTIVSGQGRTECSTEPEIRALLLGLRSVPPGSRVRLLTDRQDLVEKLRDGGTLRGRLEGLMAEVREECSRRTVLPIWVRGHRGHPAHTACDRAAKRAALRVRVLN